MATLSPKSRGNELVRDGRARHNVASHCAAIVAICVVCGVHPALAHDDEATPAPAAQAVSDRPLYAAPTTLDGAGRIVAPVMINNKGPFRFLVDTGANRSVLTPHVVQTLGLTLSERPSITVSGVTGQTIAQSATVAHLEAGALVLKNVQLPVVGATMAGLDGILGVEGFADKRVSVDFIRDRIKIERSRNEPAPRGFTTLSARFRHGQLVIVNILVGSVKSKAVIDTGAELSLGNEQLRQALRHQATADRRDGRAIVEGVTADVQSGDMIYAPPIRFEGLDIEGVKIAYGNFYVFKFWDLENEPAMLIGMDMIGTVSEFAIDYRRREVQVKPRTWHN